MYSLKWPFSIGGQLIIVSHIVVQNLQLNTCAPTAAVVARNIRLARCQEACYQVKRSPNGGSTLWAVASLSDISKSSYNLRNE